MTAGYGEQEPAAGAPPAPSWPLPPSGPTSAVGPAPYPSPAVVSPAPAVSPRRPRRWPAVLALVLALLLVPVAGAQGYLLYEMDRRLDAANRQIAADRSTEDTRLDGLEQRASELEKELGSQFNPAAVAAAALPSVFRVDAGDFTGTAFAAGREPAGGGTYLFTNHHVVEQVWDRGGREVFIERRDRRFPVTIVKVDKKNDVALLQAKERFPRLATGTEKVRSGEQVAVVGAPLGLEDSVTTGVVSAYRNMPDFPGEVFQFDAAINPGNSGGPVLNSQKQVVGIATAKAREAEGIGLAVPIATACAVLSVC